MLVVNGSATARSTLKNLVLPGKLAVLGPSRPARLPPNLPKLDHPTDSPLYDAGIGHFTILDPNNVTGPDLGNNFFLESDSLGKARAEEVVKYLAELNSDVEGHALVKVSQHCRL